MECWWTFLNFNSYNHNTQIREARGTVNLEGDFFLHQQHTLFYLLHSSGLKIPKRLHIFRTTALLMSQPRNQKHGLLWSMLFFQMYMICQNVIFNIWYLKDAVEQWSYMTSMHTLINLKKKKASPLPLVNSWMQIKETLYFFEFSFSPQSNLVQCHSLSWLLSHIIQRQWDKNITECWSCIENIPQSLVLFIHLTSVIKLHPQKHTTSMTRDILLKIISWALSLQHTKSSRMV